MVLATAIAETSLTIDGVQVVVDSGLSRVPSFPRGRECRGSRRCACRVHRPSSGSGRAGRIAPGVCYRLWAAEEHAGLLERDRPEILQADLAPFALELAVAGVVDASSLRWLDQPPAPALAQARELLVQLGAIDGEYRITSHGRAMASFGVHPRLAHMMLRGHELGFGATACVVAALLDERDPMRHGAVAPDADIRHRVAIVEGRERSANVDRDTVQRVREQARAWRATLRGLIACGRRRRRMWSRARARVPDRVAQRRPGGGTLRPSQRTRRAAAGRLLADG